MKNISFQMDALTKKSASALFIDAQEILTRSRQEFVPVRNGTLQGDSGVTKPRMEGGRLEVGIWYGNGPARAYALAIHEHPQSPPSPRSWRGGVNFKKGGPKYLEIPFLEYAAEMLRSIGSRIRF
jgi:hypothetical protein